MNWAALHRRNFFFHSRTNLAVLLGVLAGAAALTGALLVGDSMRGSLRRMALERLGYVDYALTPGRFFREELAASVQRRPGIDPSAHFVVPVILLNGAASHADSSARAGRVNVLGTNESFWNLDDARFKPKPVLYRPSPAFTDRRVILNQALAEQLNAQRGDELLIYLGKPNAISTETLLGRRDQTTLVLRLTVQDILNDEGVGVFSLDAVQRRPYNAYVPLATLQRALGQPGRVNILLIGQRNTLAPSENLAGELRDLQGCLRESATLEDFGLRFRLDETRDYASLESESMLLEPSIETAALVAAHVNNTAFPVRLSIYLANEIHAASRSIPYSTVAAAGPILSAISPLKLTDGTDAPTLQSGEIYLNEWAANDLQAKPGDAITLTYYVTESFGRLATKQHTFQLRGVVRLDGAAADPGFTPEYRGVTDTQSIADWDPPFPMDLKKIRDKDEEYWKKYRATPKAFISLPDGQTLWAEQGERFGRLTAIRIGPAKGLTLAETAEAWKNELLKRLDFQALGFRFEPVRQQALAASAGNTDFGQLFIGFSFFLILSAAMLVALLFRLGIERRASEIGLLLAVGLPPQRVRRFLLMEGLLIAGVGAALGQLAALGYAWLMLAGLRSWWFAAVNAPFLRLHGSWTSFVIGYVASVGVALLSIAWALRGLTRAPCRALLAGVVPAQRPDFCQRRRRLAFWLAIVFAMTAILLMGLALFTKKIPPAIAFWCGGAAALAAGLAGLLDWLKQERRGVIHKPGWGAWLRLGARNAVRQPTRSLLTIGLVASAVFVIVSLQAFRLEADDSTLKTSGTGGFALLAEAVTPLPYDLNTPAGRAELNVVPDAETVLANTQVSSFRLRPGDETSCLNLYQSNRPRILGATPSFIQRGGFRFGATLAQTPEEKQNPWLLLNRRFEDGAVPVIGDESAVKWQLHRDVGEDLKITDERGRTVALRFVALLQSSVLQSELVVAEAEFTRLFPAINGHAFFLIETAAQNMVAVERDLERELAAFGLDVSSTKDRLNDYLAVQNTYLSTFQTLGGFGLILGTIGLAAVLLRNVWERRSELALMQAVGFSRAALGWTVLAENAALILAGLLLGTAAALLAIAPAVLARPDTIPWLSMGMILTAVFGVGLIAGLLALRPALRTPLLAALRAE